MSMFGSIIFPRMSGLTAPGAQPCHFFGGHASPLRAMLARPVLTAGVHKSFFAGAPPSAAKSSPSVGSTIDRAG